jgi:cysteine-rich repeat protein
VLSDPAVNVPGSTVGHANEGDTECRADTGPEVVYALTAANTGVLEVSISTSAALFVSLRNSCEPMGTDLACSVATKQKIAVTQNDVVYVVVEGLDAEDAGSYTLSAESRAVECGDFNRDETEECDDGDEMSGDGCSDMCEVESDEANEPNNTPDTGEGPLDPSSEDTFVGWIEPADDVDVIRVTLSSAVSSLSAQTVDFGDGACADDLMDSYIRILGKDKTSVEAENDDRPGGNLCARAETGALTSGTYYVEVSASVDGETPTFPYVLRLEITP